MTYTESNETYVVTGVPMTIVDQCGSETVGHKLTFVEGDQHRHRRRRPEPHPDQRRRRQVLLIDP